MSQTNDCQYIETPMNLFYLMDANCSKVLITLVQMNSYYPQTDGYFKCAYKTLELACGLSQNIIKACLAGLYLEGLVDVISVGKGRGKHTNRYKVNVEKFKDYEKIPVGVAIMTEDKPIHQVKYYGTRFKLPWDVHKSEYEVAQENAQRTAQCIAQNLTTNITNIDNITNIKNIDNINNNIIKEDNIILKEEENNITEEECIKTFVEDNINLDYILLTCSKGRFFNKYKDKVLELEKDIGIKTGNTFSIEVILDNIYDYVQVAGVL